VLVGLLDVEVDEYLCGIFLFTEMLFLFGNKYIN
jgi:hypothetical protein